LTASTATTSPNRFVTPASVTAATDDRPVDGAAAGLTDEEMFADGAGSANETSKSIRRQREPDAGNG
jgi:hypothetical protein